MFFCTWGRDIRQEDKRLIKHNGHYYDVMDSLWIVAKSRLGKERVWGGGGGDGVGG